MSVFPKPASARIVAIPTSHFTAFDAYCHGCGGGATVGDAPFTRRDLRRPRQAGCDRSASVLQKRR